MNGYATDLVVVVVLTCLSWSDLLLWWGWFFAWCLLFCRSRVVCDCNEDDVKFEVLAEWWLEECIVLAAAVECNAVDEVVEEEAVPDLKVLLERRLFPNAATAEADEFEFRLLPPRLWLEGLNEVIVMYVSCLLIGSIWYTNQDCIYIGAAVISFLKCQTISLSLRS